MKSLVALLIVIVALAGMVGSILFLYRHPWANSALRSQFDSVQPEEVKLIAITSDKTHANIVVTDRQETARIVQAFRQATSPRSDYSELTAWITFTFTDNRPPIKLRFPPNAVDSYFGPDVAKALEPYLGRL